LPDLWSGFGGVDSVVGRIPALPEVRLGFSRAALVVVFDTDVLAAIGGLCERDLRPWHFVWRRWLCQRGMPGVWQLKPRVLDSSTVRSPHVVVDA